MQEIEIFHPISLAAWRQWLEKNHLSKPSVWLVFYNKNSKNTSITWSEAVDVALCFGWIDSKKISIDRETAHQFFSKRKPKSTWSKINKQKIELLTARGLMTAEGFKSVEIAKQNGSWTFLDEVEALIIPDDLKAELKDRPVARDYFESLSKSAKKAILHRLVMAKRPETREKRIIEIIESTDQKQRPKRLW